MQMRQIAVRVLCLAAVLALPSVASAQAKKGDQEVLFFGNLTSILTPDFTITTGTLFGNFGQFVTDAAEIGWGASMSISSADGDTSATTGVNGFFRFYFGEQSAKVKPYTGAEYFVQDLSDAGNTQFLSGLFGVKNYLNDTTAVDFKAGYGFNPKDASEFQLFSFSVGLTFLF
jgi:hypothetical protein